MEIIRVESNNFAKHEVIRDGVLQYKYESDGTKTVYEMKRVRNYIIFQKILENTNDGKTLSIEQKNVPIEYDTDYRYRILKRKIKAIDGVEGLWNFFEREVNQDATGGFARVVANKVFEYMSDKL